MEDAKLQLRRSNSKLSEAPSAASHSIIPNAIAEEETPTETATELVEGLEKCLAPQLASLAKAAALLKARRASGTAAAPSHHVERRTSAWLHDAVPDTPSVGTHAVRGGIADLSGVSAVAMQLKRRRQQQQQQQRVGMRKANAR